MAAGRKPQLDNNIDGHNYQQFTLLYVINRLLKNEDVKDFRVGSAMADYGALDDVVFKVELINGNVITYAIQAKHSKKVIDDVYFRDKPETYAFKYFKSFLDIKKRISELEQLGQLILWTTMSIVPGVKENWFVEYVPQGSVDGDLLGNCKELDANVGRYRFKNKDNGKYPEFAECFLERLHPRTVLVEQFVGVLFKKDVWRSGGAARNFRCVMANEIINCEGDRPTFRQAFIDGDEKELQAETIEFRECFEAVIRRKFNEKKCGQFSMANLNDDYQKYIELKVDDQFGSELDPDAQWPRWEVLADESDLEQFFKRFLFYVCIPQENMLKGFLMKNDVDGFNQFSYLIKEFTNQEMIDRKQINQISNLIRLRQNMDIGPYGDLKFIGTEDLHSKVSHLLASEESLLIIKSTKNVDCTVSKLISIVETGLAPESKRYLVFTSTNFDLKIQELLPLLDDDKLLESVLKCIIVSFVDRDQIKEIKTKLSSKKIKAILVGNGLEQGLEDNLDMEHLDEDSKNKIRNRFIALSVSQKATAGTIFSKDLFRTENLDLVLELYRSEQTLEIKSNELKRCEFFKPRRLIHKYTGSVDHVASFTPTIISDQAGAGKTAEMVDRVLRERQERCDHLVLYLHCTEIVRMFTGNIQDTICKMIAPNDDIKSALIKELFQLGKVSLYMDNYDEVSESSNPKLRSLLKKISREKIHNLYIAARPHFEAQLVDIFPHSIVCCLEPFSEIDQIDYVKTLWGWHLYKEESKSHQIEDNAKKLINLYRPIAALLKTPLYIHMIATINKDVESNSNLSLGAIFEKFINYKLKQFIGKFNEANNLHQQLVKKYTHDFLPSHGCLAFKMFNDVPEAEIRKLCEKLQMYGLVELEPSPGFIHQTFQEYFLVRYFLTETSPSIVDIWRKFVERILRTQQSDIVLEFLDFHIDPNHSYPGLIRQICDFLHNNLTEREREELIQGSEHNNRRKLLGVLRKSLKLITVP